MSENKQQKPRIPDGTPVTWTNHAGPHRKTKNGIVIAFLPAYTWPRNVLNRPMRSWERCDRYECGAGNDCYIVAVNRGGNSHLVDLYLPCAGVLERQNPDKLTNEAYRSH